VFGDHCSPLSDTSILASTGAASDHIDHIKTQLPYALVVAVISLVAYLTLGLFT
jgi:Na+/H+ antiporter NhaC